MSAPVEAPVLLFLLLACTAPSEPPPVGPAESDVPADPLDSDTPLAPVEDAEPAFAQCIEAYRVPGPLGTDEERAVDAHADVFGVPEELRAGVMIGPDPVHVHLGYPGQDTSRSISFVWHTDRATLASVVEWGPGAELTQRSEGVSFAYGGADRLSYRAHELKLCGRLEPNTTYSYRVGGEGHWSPVYQFTTPGAPGSFDRLTIAMAGDSRGAYETWSRVVRRMESHDPDLYLFSGDMVQTGSNESEWYAWWEATGDVFTRKVMVPAHGNHELLSSNYFATFSLPGNEQWFSLDFGSMTLLSLNDTVSEYPEFLETEQVAFLHKQLSATTAPWTVAMHHQAMYSICSQHRSRQDIRGWWGPELDEHAVDLVLAGHNHIYERSFPIRSGAVQPPGQGTTYLVAGGAGAPLYRRFEADWFNEVVNPVEHYVIAELGPEAIVVTVRDLSDNVVDRFEIPAG